MNYWEKLLEGLVLNPKVFPDFSNPNDRVIVENGTDEKRMADESLMNFYMRLILLGKKQDDGSFGLIDSSKIQS